MKVPPPGSAKEGPDCDEEGQENRTSENFEDVCIYICSNGKYTGKLCQHE